MRPGNPAPGDASDTAPAQVWRPFHDQSFGKLEWRGGHAAGIGTINLSKTMRLALLPTTES